MTKKKGHHKPLAYALHGAPGEDTTKYRKLCEKGEIQKHLDSCSRLCDAKSDSGEGR